MKTARSIVCLIALVLSCVLGARAHVGSPDVYAEGQAGPYRLSIVVRPPLVIPGVAEIEVRAQTSGIDRISITPIPLTGEAAAHPPVPDAMQRPSGDTQFYTGHLWIMATDSWQIRFVVTGINGEGVLSIPLPAAAIATRAMTPGLGVLLAVLGVLLVLGLVGIVGAAAREARLTPGLSVPQTNRRRAVIAMSVTFVLLVTGLIFGKMWWNNEAADYSAIIYKPLQMTASVEPGNVLDLKLHDPGWLKGRKLDDLIPDHNHLMHLYMIRWPQMDVVFHLHPEPVATGEFQLPLPSVPAGDYRLYADIVHSMGFPETIVGDITLPAIQGRPLAGDNAEGTDTPVNSAPTASLVEASASSTRDQRFPLPDGYSMVWHAPARLVPKAPFSFSFELLDRSGKPASDTALYMGMLGHAAFVKTDGSVFAHIHPTGTVSMAAFMMANPQPQAAATPMAMQVMPGMSQAEMNGVSLPSTVSFPYGFPTPGRYRIIVQMKHGATIETGIFDADVSNPPN